MVGTGACLHIYRAVASLEKEWESSHSEKQEERVVIHKFKRANEERGMWSGS